MKKLRNFVAVAVFSAMSVAAYAAVTIDDAGYGFVGKGDVQLAMDWNNAQLQGDAQYIRFRFAMSEETSWECVNVVHGVEKNRQTKKTAQDVSGSVAYDARKNKQGMITGFNLNGFEGEPYSTTEGDALYSCPSGTNWSFVEGSVVRNTLSDGTLQVSGDDGHTWVDLPITQ